jgi:paraquat-inducible protein A
MFIIGNVFPLLSMTVQGRTTSATLIGMAEGLQEAGMTSVAGLVAVTIVVMPALELAALGYLLMPLVLAERVPPHLRAASQLLELVKPWALIEVLMLGVLVSIGRLEKIGSIDLGFGFWALAAMMLLFALIDSVFELPLVWDRAEELAR